MTQEITDQGAQDNTDSGQGQETAQQTEATQSETTQEGSRKSILAEEGTPEKQEAPETYADFTLPEGYEIDKGLLGKFSELAKEVNLSQESAQKLVDLVSEQSVKEAQERDSELNEIRDKWIDDLKKDPEFGGEKFKDTIGRARRFVSKYGSKELFEVLEKTGLGDNNELLKAFARADKATGEDTLVDGKPADNKGKSMAEIMYPNMGK